MKIKNLLLVCLSIALFSACSKDNSTDNSIGNPGGPSIDTTKNENEYTPGKTMYIDDLVLYTSDGAYRDPQMLKDFVKRNFPDDVNVFSYGQSSISYNNSIPSLEFLGNNRVKLKDMLMEIVSRTDTELLLSPLDSTKMPGPESQWLGHCMLLHEQVPQYNPYAICQSAGGNCKKYRKIYPVKISGKDYYLPILTYAVVSNCSILFYNSAPMPDYFNKGILNGLLQNKDSVIVQTGRLPLIK
jgi:hypothetical protein